MTGKWTKGILAGVFLAAIGLGVTQDRAIGNTAKNAVENAGYSDVTVSRRLLKAGSGCHIMSERFAYNFDAQAKDGKPASGTVCMSGLLSRTPRIVPAAQ